MSNIQLVKAVLIGIQKYEMSSMHSLDGPYADIQNMSKFIKSINLKCAIKILSDRRSNNILTESSDFIEATKNNIINELSNIYKGVNENECVFVYYSGHGSNINSQNKDEYDTQYDQVMNVVNNEIIIDSELHELLVSNRPPNIDTFVIMDCCHSGDMLDLDYKLINSRFSRIRNFNKNKDKINKNNMRGKTIMISGCSFTQSTTDAPKGGAFTKRFLDIMNDNNNNITYLNLFNDLYKRLNYLKIYFGISQEPQIFSSIFSDSNDYLFL
jgi:hypothetical protein